MKVFRINFGRDNYLWPDCRASRRLMMYDDVQVFEARKERNFELARSLIDARVRRRPNYSNGVVTRYLNQFSEFESSAGDLWVHIDKEYLWWCVSEPGFAEGDHFEVREPSGEIFEAVKLWKQTKDGWSNKDQRGRELKAHAIHPTLSGTIIQMGTLSGVRGEIEEAINALVEGKTLERFYGLPRWVQDAKKYGWVPQQDIPTVDRRWWQAINRMCDNALGAVERSGKVSTATYKEKSIDLGRYELELHVKELLLAQLSRCAYTGMEMLDDSQTPDYLRVSLDRIDSSVGYLKGNLHLVCRFLNQMKSDTPHEQFLEYLSLIRLSRSVDESE